MTQILIRIHELAGWGFDPEADRSLLDTEALRRGARKAAAILPERAPYRPESPCLDQENQHLRMLLSDRAESVARSGEFDGLGWKLAVVDLEKLIAFQRRLGFEDKRQIGIPDPVDIEALLDLTVPRISRQAAVTSPYMEVAFYRVRWFLRDGYHRSSCLLRRGIHRVPAVVVHARTLGELGAVGHKFFPEDILFSARPPMACDFSNEALTVRYIRFESASPVPEPAPADCHLQEGK